MVPLSLSNVTSGVSQACEPDGPELETREAQLHNHKTSTKTYSIKFSLLLYDIIF